MRSLGPLGIALLALVVVNASLMSLRRAASVDRAALTVQASAVTESADRERLSAERRRALDELIAKARVHDDLPRDIGALRDVLIGAERGLSIDRLSLDFRPEERTVPGLGGTRVQATLRGRFEAVYGYLNRIEAMFLPLSLGALTLRSDAASVTLSVQWRARWPLVGSGDVVELSATEVSQLDGWLGRAAPPPRLARDLFLFRDPDERRDATPRAPAAEDVAEENAESQLDPEPDRPVLTGFVLARPELEPDVRRRVLAALRYRGETRLVKVGDAIGGYVVDGMEARDSVTLTDAATGEKLRLTFD